ncbi:MAG: ATP-binding protein, partial [Chloroflexota bacterium]|nr:ATP-binding protein [Chloroflexota bacterium]
MEFVDRNREVAQLRSLQAAPPSLAIIRGRRRVGKSSLLSAALQGPRVVSFQADEQPVSGQLTLLAAEAARLLPGAPTISFAGWEEALRFF